jgi:hypothetical protein
LLSEKFGFLHPLSGFGLTLFLQLAKLASLRCMLR